MLLCMGSNPFTPNKFCCLLGEIGKHDGFKIHSSTSYWFKSNSKQQNLCIKKFMYAINKISYYFFS